MLQTVLPSRSSLVTSHIDAPDSETFWPSEYSTPPPGAAGPCSPTAAGAATTDRPRRSASGRTRSCRVGRGGVATDVSRSVAVEGDGTDGVGVTQAEDAAVPVVAGAVPPHQESVRRTDGGSVSTPAPGSKSTVAVKEPPIQSRPDASTASAPGSSSRRTTERPPPDEGAGGGQLDDVDVELLVRPASGAGPLAAPGSRSTCPRKAPTTWTLPSAAIAASGRTRRPRTVRRP